MSSSYDLEEKKYTRVKTIFYVFLLRSISLRRTAPQNPFQCCIIPNDRTCSLSLSLSRCLSFSNPCDLYVPFRGSRFVDRIFLGSRRVEDNPPAFALVIYEYYLSGALLTSRSLGPDDDLDVTRTRAMAQYYDAPEGAFGLLQIEDVKKTERGRGQSHDRLWHFKRARG